MKTPTYSIFSVLARPSELELALGFLYREGVDTVCEQRVRRGISITGSLPTSCGPARFAQKLKRYSNAKGERLFREIEIRKIQENGWAKNYQNYLKPFPFLFEGKGKSGKPTLWINPLENTESSQAKLGAPALFLKAGLAFGTGAHPTTQMAGELLATVLAAQKNGDVLDLGCGSGILTMAAKKLGARKVVGVDNDPVAIQVAQENCAENALEGIQLALKIPRRRFDCIVANILLKTLIELKSTILQHLKPKGFLILSGLTYRDRREILQAYSSLNLLESRNRKGWTACLLQAN